MRLHNPLPIPIPPMLEQAVGYTGQARYFALYWTPAGDEAMVADGQIAGDGDWHAYLTFVDHPAVVLGLMPHRHLLGSSDEPATHWLVIDRTERKAFVLPAYAAENFLRSQWTLTREPVTLTPEQMTDLIEHLNAQLAAMPLPSWAEVQARMAEQAAVNQALQAWLDQHTPADAPEFPAYVGWDGAEHSEF